MAKKKHEEMLNIPGHKGKANQNQLQLHLTPVRMTITKNTNNKHWQGCVCWRESVN
jgi:hypothetical protein